MMAPTDQRRPRVYASGGTVRLTCHRGHYLAAIPRREWAGSNVEAMAGAPVRCAECARPESTR